MASSVNRNRPVLGSSFLGRASSYLSRVPRPILFTFTFLTSSYLLTTVLLSKLLAIHNRINAESTSKEGLKQRFERNQQDVDFTVLALLPSLKAEMDKVMDVDAITRELKSVGKEAPQPPAVSASVGKTNPVQQREGEAAAASAAAADMKPEPKEADQPKAPQADEPLRAQPPLAFAQSWKATSDGEPSSHEPAPSALDAISEPRPEPIAPHATINGEQEGSAAAASQGDEHAGADPATNGHAEGVDGNAADSEGQVNGAMEGTSDAPKEAEATDSLQPSSSAEAQQQEDVQESASQPTEDPEAIALAESQRQQQLALDRKRKAALWQQLKIVTFTRSLTAIYAISLLSVLTHVQLNLLGRYAYLRDLAGVKQAAAEAEQAETARRLASDPFEDAWASASGTQASGSSSQAKGTEKSAGDTSSISAETEERYLTFSWYLLHQGWKDLGERVREKVEEVMSSVPLKTQLSHEELTSILRRIRRRIEYDYESEGDEGDGDGADDLPSPGSSAAAARPYTFPGGHTLDSSAGSSMALGAESLMPNGFSFPEEAKSEAGSSSMSGSGTLSVTTNGRGSTSGRRRRRRRTRFDLLRAYLLPATPEGDVALLRNAGLFPSNNMRSQQKNERGAGLEEQDPSLGALLDETRDILESSDAQDVSRRCLEACFETQLLDALRAPFGLSPSPPSAASPFPNEAQLGASSGSKEPHATSGSGSASAGRFSEILTAQQEAEIRNDPSGTIGRRLKLAAVLPLLASRGTVAFDALPNEVVETIAANKDLQAFSAIIYTSFTGDCL